MFQDRRTDQLLFLLSFLAADSDFVSNLLIISLTWVGFEVNVFNLTFSAPISNLSLCTFLTFSSTAIWRSSFLTSFSFSFLFLSRSSYWKCFPIFDCRLERILDCSNFPEFSSMQVYDRGTRVMIKDPIGLTQESKNWYDKIVLCVLGSNPYQQNFICLSTNMASSNFKPPP